MEITEQNLLIKNAEISEFEKEIDQIDVDAAALKVKKEAAQAEIDKIKLDILTSMKENGQTKAEFDFIVVTAKKAQKVVSITDFKKLDLKFKRPVKEKALAAGDFDKAEIKKALNALKEDETLPGAELIDGNASLKIEEIT